MLKILHITDTPLAGAPYHIVDALNKYSDLHIDLLMLRDRYSDGRIFPTPAKEPKELNYYDIIHIHNYIPPKIKNDVYKFKGKIIVTLHSVPRKEGTKELIELAGLQNVYIIAQPYQFKEYQDILKNHPKNILPTIFDINSYLFTFPKKDRVTINFAPSNKLPLSHPASKGYYEVLRVLDKIDKKLDVDILVYSNKKHVEDLALKSQSHIIIDDVANPTFHLTSLFGLCGNCFVISGVNKKNYLVLKRIGIKNKPPIIYSDLGILDDVLTKLIYDIEYKGFECNSRDWIFRNYNPKKLRGLYEEVYTK